MSFPSILWIRLITKTYQRSTCVGWRHRSHQIYPLLARRTCDVHLEDLLGTRNQSFLGHKVSSLTNDLQHIQMKHSSCLLFASARWRQQMNSPVDQAEIPLPDLSYIKESKNHVDRTVKTTRVATVKLIMLDIKLDHGWYQAWSWLTWPAWSVLIS